MRERYGSAKLKELCCLKDWPSDGIERSIKSDEPTAPLQRKVSVLATTPCRGLSLCGSMDLVNSLELRTPWP